MVSIVVVLKAILKLLSAPISCHNPIHRWAWNNKLNRFLGRLLLLLWEAIGQVSVILRCIRHPWKLI
jgi:hypothetical protein